MDSFHKPKIYRIKLKGLLDPEWADWFEGLTISHAKNITILEGEIKDNASLFGFLTKLFDLNLTVISLEQINFNDTTNN